MLFLRPTLLSLMGLLLNSDRRSKSICLSFSFHCVFFILFPTPLSFSLQLSQWSCFLSAFYFRLSSQKLDFHFPAADPSQSSFSLCSFSCSAFDLLSTIPTCRSLMFSLHLYPVWSNQYSSANRGDCLAIPHKERFFFLSDRLLEVRRHSAPTFNGHLIKNSVRFLKWWIPHVKE